MGKVWLVTKRELNGYFRTWTGYIIAFFALIINGLLFNSFAIGDQAKYSAEVLEDFFYFSSGIAMVACVFLAMRLLAEERQSKTIVLFFTSPITERQIIYGKFLSAFVVFFLLQIFSLYLPSLIFVEGKVSLGHLAAGYFGVILLGTAVIAISLFSSVVAPNQMVAGILGASFTVVLLIFWILSNVTDEPFKEVFSYIAIHNMHFIPFSRGIVHLRDVVYYLSVIVFFLECSVRVLETRRLEG
ncbi:MAG: ABC transporter permease [Oligoflexales bacterium]